MSVSARTLVCLLSITSVLWNASAQEALGPGSEASLFELNSTMVTFDAPSTYLFLGWQTDVNALFQDGLDCVSAYIDLPHSNQILLRSATLGLFTGVSLVVNRAFSLTAHDEGHMEAARAIGASAVYLESESNGQEMSIW